MSCCNSNIKQVSKLVSKYDKNIKQMSVVPSQLCLKNVYRISNKYQRWSSNITNKSNKWMWFLISLLSKMVIKYETLANSNCQDMVVKLTDKKKHVCQELVDTINTELLLSFFCFFTWSSCWAPLFWSHPSSFYHDNEIFQPLCFIFDQIEITIFHLR